MNNRNNIYLDHAAATPMDPAVMEAMWPYLSEKFYNPSALYLASKEVLSDINKARASVARMVGSRPAEIIFTAGGTEANNLAVQGVMDNFPGSNVIVSSIEHDSVLGPAKKYDLKIAPVTNEGLVKLDELEKLIDDKTVLVSVMLANNEIGSIQPVREAAKLVAEERAKRARQQPASSHQLPIYLHTDVCQAAAYLDLNVSRLGVDMLTLNGGKIYGPKQSGVLFVKSDVVLAPLIYGGGQESGFRSGTENVAGIIGFSKALELVQDRRKDESDRLKKLQESFIKDLIAKVPAAVINGSKTKRLPNNIHVTFPGRDNERLLMELDEAGIICAVGSACSASNDEPSHVLGAIGLSDEEARSSLRFTLGQSNDAEQIKTVVDRLAEFNNKS